LIDIRKKRGINNIKNNAIKLANDQIKKVTSKNKQRYKPKNIEYKIRTGNSSVSKINSKRPKYQAPSVGQSIAHSSSHNIHFDSCKIFHLIV
jgi:hypothetical protein